MFVGTRTDANRPDGKNRRLRDSRTQYQLILISPLSILRTHAGYRRQHLILISLYNKAGRRIAHWARMVADYGVALPGRQGWGYIEWPGAHHGGVERVRPWQRGEGVRSDELRGGVERTYELMHGGGSVRCAYELKSRGKCTATFPEENNRGNSVAR